MILMTPYVWHRGVQGVRAVSLDRTCLDDMDETSDTGTAADSTPSTESTTTTTITTAAPPDSEAGLDSLADLIAGDPLFSQLAGLVELAGLAGFDGLAADGPLTVLAPTDTAFDAAFEDLGADAFGELISDPESLRTLLLHHVTEGRVTANDLVTGQLPMLDGTDVEVNAEELMFTSGESVAGVADPETQLDIEASNGVVHAIDRILDPIGLELSPSSSAPELTAEFTNGVMVLSGQVSVAEQRAQLLAAAGAIDPANIVDELTINAAAPPSAVDLDRFAVVVEAMSTSLVSGTASLVAGDITLEGVVRGVDARAALEQLVTRSGIAAELSHRPVGDAAAAQAMEDELNEFVVRNPIQFEPGSPELAAEANAVLEQIAGRALRLDGIDIVVVGYTDTDGSADTNQQLSDGRATVVRDALVELGLDDAALTSQGRGEVDPVLTDDGTEDKVASRRVEFVVEAR
jgi:outer membrane protein OmpA-like peptidoglycan-associated protein/uncharacterized surface protein with fasciclin (FAS1) repeats